MSIALTGTGGLFTRIGRIGKFAYLLDSYQAGLPAAFTSLWAQYLSALQPINAPNQIVADSLTRSSSSLMGIFQQLAQQTLIGMVTADQPGLTPSISNCLVELRRQMIAGSASIARCTVGATAAAIGSPTGSPTIVATTQRGDGLVNENIIAEVGRLQCIADSYSGSAALGSEQYRYTGAQQTGGVWDYDYPQGSSSSATFTAVSYTSGTLLTDGSFEVWSGTPLALSNWTLTVGTWGTDIIRSTTAFDGTYSVKLADTGVLVAFHQAIAGLTANNSYAVNFQLTCDGTVTAGSLHVELTDGTGTVTNDSQGNANSGTIALTGLSSGTWTTFSFVFRVPATPPAALWLRFRLTTGIAGANVYLDGSAMAPLTSLYPGGPGVTIFAALGATVGRAPAQIGDLYSLTMTNNRASATYLATFQALFDRLFQTRLLGILLPSSASPTIADSLITT